MMVSIIFDYCEGADITQQLIWTQAQDTDIEHFCRMKSRGRLWKDFALNEEVNNQG